MKTIAFDLLDDRLRAARRLLAGAAAAGLLSVVLAGGVSADTAASGNGGTSVADASGGPVAVGTVDEGEETTGTDITVGLVSGGDVAATAIGIILAE